MAHQVKFAWIVSLAALPLVVFGCGSDDDNQSGTGGTTSASGGSSGTTGGTTGTTGGTTGTTGGTTGTAGEAGAAGAGAPPPFVCESELPTDGSECANNGGACQTGSTLCLCVGGMWQCSDTTDCPDDQPERNAACPDNDGLVCAFGTETGCLCETRGQSLQWRCVPIRIGGMGQGGAGGVGGAGGAGGR